jgi:hypothetical protein
MFSLQEDPKYYSSVDHDYYGLERQYMLLEKLRKQILCHHHQNGMWEFSHAPFVYIKILGTDTIRLFLPELTFLPTLPCIICNTGADATRKKCIFQIVFLLFFRYEISMAVAI